MTTRRRWTEDTIAAELRPIVGELGRMPTRSECAARGVPGLWGAMQRNGGVEGWSARVAGPGHEDIAVRAYHLAQERGGRDPMADWLDAERELKG